MNELHLLEILSDNPRISAEDLAQMLELSVEEVVRMQKELEDKKIICGYHTVVNWDKVDTDHCSAIIEVSAKPERDLGYDRVASRIAKYSEVTSLYLLSGKSEFMVSIEGKTMRQISDFVATKLAPIEGVTATTTVFLLKQYKVGGVILDDERPVDERMLVKA